MFGKNKNKKVGLCVMVVTSCFILAGLWAVLATPETALAHKDPENPDHSHGGGGGGGGGGGDQPCVIFDDFVGDSVQSDGHDPDDPDKGLPYCNNKKDKITVKFSKLTNDSLYLQTNSTDKAANGRGIFIDFGTKVTLSNGMEIQTTDDALADIQGRVLGVSADLNVGAHQEFNFYNMPIGVDNNVNLRIRVWFYFKDGSGDKRDSLLIRLAPNGSGRYCPSSDSVTVTRLEDADGLRMWRVETLETAVNGACISRSNECEEGDPESNEKCRLLDVNTVGLDTGHIALSFGFTVTAAP